MVPESRIDTSVRRILQMKDWLGLLQDPLMVGDRDMTTLAWSLIATGCKRVPCTLGLATDRLLALFLWAGRMPWSVLTPRTSQPV